jgi:hypothetical protein
MASTEPRIFKRGPDFNITLSLPTYVVAGHFSTYTGTAQIRKYQDSTEEGLIADLVFEWIDPEDARSFTIKCTDTSDWPLGLAEMDVLLTGPGENGAKIGTGTVLIQITRGITQPTWA